MAPDALRGLEASVARTARLVGVASLVGGSAGTVIFAILKGYSAAGFAAGYAIGVINAFWLLRIARKGVRMEPEKAGKFVTRGYQLRFAATALVLAALMAKGVFAVISLLLGLGASLAVTKGVMIYAAKKEA